MGSGVEVEQRPGPGGGCGAAGVSQREEPEHRP